MVDNKNRKKRIMLMAGEHSGDIHGAYLAGEIKKQMSDSEIIGLGGSRMKEAGVDIIMDITEKHSIGFLSNFSTVLTNMPELVSLRKKMKNIFQYYPPDVLVLIDNQGLNMYFAEMARKSGVKVIYYIPPQEWLWGSLKGGRKVARTVDSIIAIFDKEYQYYSQFEGKTVFFGHPLRDIIPQEYQNESVKPKEDKIIGLFPGSRKNEINMLGPVLRDIAQDLYEKDKTLKFIVNIADTADEEKVKKIFEGAEYPIDFATRNNYEIISKAALVIGASGTLSLECAILQTPMIVLYRLKSLDYFFAKKIMKISVDYISMPNIIMEEMVFPEFIQEDINIENIRKVAFRIINDDYFKEQFMEKTKEIKNKLGDKGVIAKIAEFVLSEANT